MAPQTALYFMGTKVYDARVTRLRPGAPMIFELRRPRNYLRQKPDAEWRSFIELDLDDPEQIDLWLQRYGPVDAELHTGGWLRLQRLLRKFDGTFLPPNADGISFRHPHIFSDDWRLRYPDLATTLDPGPNRLFQSSEYVTDLKPFFPGDIRMFALRAETLAVYMFASALLAVWAIEPPLMRRCNWCNLWFVRGRADQRFCDRNCKTLAQARKER